jgi:iron(III) transport system permease protein
VSEVESPTVERPAVDTPASLPRSANPGTPPPGRRSRALGLAWLSWPVLAVLAVLVVIPIIAMIYGAFSNGPIGTAGGFTFSAIVRAYTTKIYLKSLLSTVVLSVVVGALSTVAGAAIAWLLTRTNVRLRRFFEFTTIAPLFLSPLVGAVAWVILAAPNSGMLNVNLRHVFGGNFTLFNVMSTPGLVWVLTIHNIPYCYLFVAAALRNIDASLEEASYLNGKGTFMTAWRVTFPLVRPAMIASFFFTAVLTTGQFSVPSILATDTNSAPLAVWIYRLTQQPPYDYGTASAIGTMMFLLTIIGIYFYRRSVANTRRFVTVTGRGSAIRKVRLGAARPLLEILMVLFFVVTVVLPYAALVIVALTPFSQTDLAHLTISLSNFTSVAKSPDVVLATKNTVILGVIAPTITVVLGLLIAVVVLRSRSRTRAAVDYLATLPIAIPGLILALGMVWVYIRTSLYGSLWILLLAFIASYIPHAARLLGNSMIQIDRSLEEASTVNGASLFRTIGRVTFPLSKPAMLSAWIMIFIFCSREINAVIILYSPNSIVLSVLTWSYMNDGSINEAAVVGILQTLLLLIGVFVARIVFRVKLSQSV